MSETLDPVLAQTLTVLADKVRNACRGGKVVPCAEIWQGAEDDFIRLAQARETAGIQDIVLIREGEHAYFYSDQLMSRTYAEASARACGDDACRMIAETVRSDSRTYPRPTATAVFKEAPFSLAPDVISRSIEELLGDPKYPDIRRVRASDGSEFLFSINHMDPGHAEALAEWAAVGYLQNP